MKEPTGSVWSIPDGSVRQRIFVAYWYFVGWWSLSLGTSIDIDSPNLEIHLPFGFLRIGWSRVYLDAVMLCPGTDTHRAWGYNARPGF